VSSGRDRLRPVRHHAQVPRYVALLRGINVGRNRKVAMADLRELLEELGQRDVRTYVQSGNAVFTSARRGTDALAGEIERAIAERLKLDVRVLVRTARELARVVDANPLPHATRDPARFNVIFLGADPAPDRVTAIDPAAFEPEEFRFGDRVVYAWYRNGTQASKLDKVLSERGLGVTTTARNWNTVTKLLALADA